MPDNGKAKKRAAGKAKKAQQELSEAELRYQTLFRQSPDGILVIDDRGRFIDFNEAAHRQLGYTREEFERLQISDIDPFQSREEVQASINNVLSKGSDVFEVRHRTKKGEIRDVHVITQLMTLSGQTVFHTIWRDISERKRVEEALTESRERYRILFDQSPDGILLIDTQGNMVEFNEAAHSMLGYTRAEFTGIRISDINLDSTDKIQACIDRLLRDGKADFEVRYRAKDGGIRDVQVISRVLVLASRSLFHSIWQDITQRKLAVKQLKDSESFLQTIIETEPECIKLLTADGTLQFMNRAGLTMIEADSLDQVKGKCVYPMIAKQYREAFRSLTEDVFRNKPGRLEFEFIGLRGLHSLLETRAVPLRNDKDEIIALLGVTRDITERKRTEEELKKSEAFVKNILETVDEGFIVIDRSYTILSANKAYLSSVNKTLEAVIGKHCYEITHRFHKPCNEAGEDCAVRRTFETGEPDTAVHTHHHESGKPVYVEIKSYPVKADSGDVISVIEVINNITDKRKLEEQLRHAQKMEAVGHLAGGIAHDFNNILTAIIGYGSMIRSKLAADDPQKYSLQQILDAAARGTNLTRGLLSFSRKQVINPKLADLNEIIKGVEKLLLRVIDEDIELKVILSSDPLIVKVDSGQIEQVLMNLVTNAKDAMPEGGCLTIRTSPVVLDQGFIDLHGYGKPGMYALLQTTDTGTGIDAKTKENIFEPFFTTKEVGKGTGLGLSIVYGIVKQHNSHITCDSEPGKGTTFKIYLPMITKELEKAEAVALPPVAGGTETILIAEDDVSVRTLVKDILKQRGYTVIEAIDGEDALARFAENSNSVQLLLLDVIMPKKNGKEVYETIKKDFSEVKAIFMSGYTADIIHKKGILEEDLNYISKPLSLEDLLRAVREVLDRTTA